MAKAQVSLPLTISNSGDAGLNWATNIDTTAPVGGSVLYDNGSLVNGSGTHAVLISVVALVAYHRRLAESEI